ncbi:probable gluconokinase [Brienomyrus brachyistius]|uniref:probable gluconokinase n=1 Tax=Brienomyrus brachyistius TaxID=42636 RepID=UPI0020B24198|nr:probable gluconokinase [Brienomyrus brachyistius]
MSASFRKMILVIMGVSGTGKSSVGKYISDKLGWTLYEGDEYHPKENIEKMSRGEPLTDQDRTPWLLHLHDIIQRELSSGANSIVICSALKKSYRQMLLFGSAPQPQACQHETVDSVCFAFLHGDFQLIHRRLLARRDHFMSADLLRSQFDALEPPTDPENAFAVDIKKSIPEVSSQIERIVSARLQT